MAEQENLIPVFIMGKQYMVPAGLTIMKAMEYAGYKLVRGVGCRGGFCGACATAYRIHGDPKLYFGLACQTVVQPNMYLAQLPFFPARRATYDITKLEPTPTTLFSPLSRSPALSGLRYLHQSVPPADRRPGLHGGRDAR
jgi:hypothetical protein